MDHIPESVDIWTQLEVLANLTIVAGYLAVPLTALRLIPMSWRNRIAGVTFFVTCATTHVYMALAPADLHGGPKSGALFWFMLANHFVQAVAVWTFVLGLAGAVRDALAVNRTRLANPPSAEAPDDGSPYGRRRR